MGHNDTAAEQPLPTPGNEPDHASSKHLMSAIVPINDHVALDVAGFWDDMNKVAERFSVATAALHVAAEAKIDADLVLEKQVSLAIYQGGIIGKNDREREAAARQLYGPLFEKAEQANKVHRQATLELRLAEIAYSHQKLFLRLDEMIVVRT